MATVTLKGNTVNLTGSELGVGAAAPQITLVNSDLSEKAVGGSTGKKQLLVVVPSLDTPVCATETRNFNQKAASLDNVEVSVISMDLPFASQRFCTTEGIDKLTVLSDFRAKEFANAYGVLIADGPLAGITARAIFVVDESGKVSYKQLVPEITAEPDYDDALNALK